MTPITTFAGRPVAVFGLGLSGIAFGGGVSATFALAYLSISAIGMYFVAPRLWRLGNEYGIAQDKIDALFEGLVEEALEPAT